MSAFGGKADIQPIHSSIAFHSYSEPHLATDNELVCNILLALLASPSPVA